jgi:hypothetical protein
MRLGFAHPVSGEQLGFETQPPEDIRGLIYVLRSTSV